MAILAHNVRQKPSACCKRSGRPPCAVAADLTADNVMLDDDEIRERMSGYLCRCKQPTRSIMRPVSAFETC